MMFMFMFLHFLIVLSMFVCCKQFTTLSSRGSQLEFVLHTYLSINKCWQPSIVNANINNALKSSGALNEYLARARTVLYNALFIVIDKSNQSDFN